MCASTVLPAKSNSDVIFCLQSYLGLTIDRCLFINPICKIGLKHKSLSIHVSSSGVYNLMFY